MFDNLQSNLDTRQSLTATTTPITVTVTIPIHMPIRMSICSSIRVAVRISIDSSSIHPDFAIYRLAYFLIRVLARTAITIQVQRCERLDSVTRLIIGFTGHIQSWITLNHQLSLLLEFDVRAGLTSKKPDGFM